MIRAGKGSGGSSLLSEMLLVANYICDYRIKLTFHKMLGPATIMSFYP